MSSYRTYRGRGELNRPLETPVKAKDGQLVRYLKTHTLPGFHGHSLYDVGKYFLRSLFRENINVRASSLSFNFFLSLFPILIFLLTLLAYLPVKGLKTRLIKELALLLPDASSKALEETILELLGQQNSGLLSFGFLLAIYFASNAYHIMINTFNRRLPLKRRRNWIQNRLTAVFLTFTVTSLVIVVLFILTQFFKFDAYMVKHDWAISSFFSYTLLIVEYLMMMGFILIAISCMYYFGPAYKKRWEFFSAGSFLASILSIISTIVFSLYVNNFNSYNKIYGSIGAIIALMVLIYINTLVVIVGFDLNISIEKASLLYKKSGNIHKKEDEATIE